MRPHLAFILGIALSLHGLNASGVTFLFSKLVDTDSELPDGESTFDSFNFMGPAHDRQDIGFIATTSDGAEGVYKLVDRNLTVVADTDTQIPGKEMPFRRFIQVSLDRTHVAFSIDCPSSGCEQGIYTDLDASLRAVADDATAAPGEPSGDVFTALVRPVLAGERVAFIADTDGDSAHGIYRESGGSLDRVVSVRSSVPGGGIYTRFDELDVEGSSVLFEATVFGIGSSQQALVLSTSAFRVRLFDGGTMAPGSSGFFRDFFSPRLEGTDVAFGATLSTPVPPGTLPRAGVYAFTGGVLRRVADSSTPVPGGTGTFNFFGDVELVGTVTFFYGAVVDPATFQTMQAGIYTDLSGTLTRVVDLTTRLGGKRIRALRFSREGVDGLSVAFTAEFLDGSEAIYRADPFPSLPTPPPLPERTGFMRDFDGDGLSDIAVYEPATGNWYIEESGSGALRFQNWGYAATEPVPGDYDGDGEADIAVFEPSTGNWYIRQSATGTLRVRNWGYAGTVPAPGDFDGDGTTDITVFEPSSGNWYILESSTETLQMHNWGYSTTVPVPANYDGVGGDDIAIYEPTTGTWFIRESGSGTLRVEQWGYSATTPHPCDYDGDGMADVTVFEPSTGNWYIQESATGVLRFRNWGYFATVPVPGFFDANAACDIAVYEQDTGNWYILESGSSALRFRNWGYSGTVPAL